MSLRTLIGSVAAKVAARFDDRAPVFYTADAVVFAPSEAGVWHVLLIERGKAPHKGKLALPGGHVDAFETSVAAARREAAEETRLLLNGVHLRELGVFDDPHRDERGRYVSVAYSTVLEHMPQVLAGDDAAVAAWMPVTVALAAADRGRMAFDHARILRRAVRAEALPV
ncbi:NUDIX domain-containing protein [Amycolatopsis japonica]